MTLFKSVLGACSWHGVMLDALLYMSFLNAIAVHLVLIFACLRNKARDGLQL